MPPTATVASYSGTLTVGDDSGILGYDEAYGFGSLSPDPTFEVGGVERSITELYVIDQDLALAFDAPFPVDYDVNPPLSTDFTLTLGTETFSSTDATHSVGSRYYEWPMALSWSEHDMVTVQIDVTATAESFRVGSRLEVLEAFITHHMPPTLAFEAEMTVGVATSFDGYFGSTGSISSNTFEVGGVQYTVNDVSFAKGTDPGFVLNISPAFPFDSFTLTLGATELQSGNAAVAGTSYKWSGTTNPNWASGATVAVKLEVPLIDICDRSPAVAHAIREATPSFDFCHMTSPIDLANLTELDLPNGKGTGLKVGDFAGLSGLTRLDLSRYDLGGLWPQLPVGVFDGLDSLTHLDISHTHLMSLDRSVFDGLDNLVELDLTDTLLRARYVPVGVFDDLDSLEILRMAYGGHQDRGITFVDEDIFRGLDTLRELDVRPIRPPDDVLAPLTSLETLNGQDYTP